MAAHAPGIVRFDVPPPGRPGAGNIAARLARTHGFEGRTSFRNWLHRIATNACLNALAKRPKRSLPDPARSAIGSTPRGPAVKSRPPGSSRIPMRRSRAFPITGRDRRRATNCASLCSSRLSWPSSSFLRANGQCCYGATCWAGRAPRRPSIEADSARGCRGRGRGRAQLERPRNCDWPGGSG
jgi:hypothetical protein